MMQSNRVFPVIGWVNRNILQGLFYLPFMYQAERIYYDATEQGTEWISCDRVDQ